LRRFSIIVLCELAGGLLLSTGAGAGGRNLADYPLRVQILDWKGFDQSTLGTLDFAKGIGHGNLFENSAARGFEFTFRCSDRLRASVGFETFPAKWSKAGLELDMLTPVIGKPGSFNSCRMKVELKDSVFIFRNRQLMAVPIATYKAWMVLHQYDPEHGMNDPILTAPAPGATGVNGVPLVPAQASPAPAPKQ
jgi:hypothetical protein